MNRQYSIDDVLGNGGAEAIEAAIADSELRTSSEIVVRIKASVAPADVRTAAEQEFERLGLGLERRLHGILLFISLEEMQVELIADDGIYSTVSKEIWKAVVNIVTLGFRSGVPAASIVMSVNLIGDVLAQYFPPESEPGDLTEESDPGSANL